MAEQQTPAHSAEEYAKCFPQPDLDSNVTKGRLQDKVAIVTGGNSGIGRAVVERLSSDGAIVAIFARGEERGNATAEETNLKGGRVTFYKVDIFDRERCQEAIQQVAEANGGRIDILVNNAAYFYCADSFVDMALDRFDKSMSANVVSCAALGQACVPYMKTGGKEGSIVNIGSVSGRTANGDGAAYCASKGGLLMLSKCMALDLSSSGIRVNVVSPGAVWTPVIKNLFGPQTIEEFAQLYGHVHMSHRIIPAAGVASVVAFLCSKDAEYITGADIPVDLGYTAMGPEGTGSKPS